MHGKCDSGTRSEWHCIWLIPLLWHRTELLMDSRKCTHLSISEKQKRYEWLQFRDTTRHDHQLSMPERDAITILLNFHFHLYLHFSRNAICLNNTIVTGIPSPTIIKVSGFRRNNRICTMFYALWIAYAFTVMYRNCITAKTAICFSE